MTGKPVRYLIETNILVRLLVGEPAAQTAATNKLFSRAAKGEVVLEVSPVIVAETYYALTSFYKRSRPEVAEQLSHLLSQPGVHLWDADEVLATLLELKTINVDFTDAYLATLSREENLTIASFDRDFRKFKNVTFHEPA